jgi:hypothetical protein
MFKQEAAGSSKTTVLLICQGELTWKPYDIVNGRQFVDDNSRQPDSCMNMHQQVELEDNFIIRGVLISP